MIAVYHFCDHFVFYDVDEVLILIMDHGNKLWYTKRNIHEVINGSSLDHRLRIKIPCHQTVLYTNCGRLPAKNTSTLAFLL